MGFENPLFVLRNTFNLVKRDENIDNIHKKLQNTQYSHIIQSRESAINKILSSNFPVPYKPLLTVVRQ